MMSEEKVKTLTAEEAGNLVGECTHHWVIESPSGPASRGLCKLCGAEREFRNYLENSPYWEDDVYLGQVSSGSRFRANTGDGDSSDSADD
jgi:hypothetical protein